MKKSIKYAGIAAATLLAVAPVAATSVQAETPATGEAAGSTTSNKKTAATDQSQQDNAVTAFGNHFGDKEANTTNFTGTAAAPKVKLGTQDLSDFADNNADLIKTDATLANMNALIGTDATVTVSAKYGNTTITNESDLYKILADDSYPAVDFTITLNYNNLLNKAQSKTFSFSATRTTSADALTTINAQFTTPVTVPLNSTTTSTQLQATTGTQLTDQNGDGIVAASSIVPSTNYYNSYSDAIDASNNDSSVTPAYTATAEDGSVATFDKAGTYYQPITFTAGEGSSLGEFLQEYVANPNKYTVYVNGKEASKGYDFVTDATSTPADTKITFVRTVVVSESEANWTVTANKGIVTTKSDSAYYTLKNDDNETIANRALAKNSAWITDQKRVDQDGNTQYRVATGEWIDANNVTFSDSTSTDNAEGEYTDVQALNGKVTLDGPNSFVYFLFDNNGKQIANRAVNGDSAWYTDKKATNAAGKTVYHVATGEWLQEGSGVNYVAY